MSKSDFHIDTMTKKELNDIGIMAAKEEGWNPGLHDADCFYAQDPHGYFVGRLNGQAIGCCAGVIYDDNFAFFGLYRVAKAFRHQHYGMAMTQHRLKYVGDRNIGLDGVVDMCDKYANIGFRKAHLNIRYQGQIKPNTILPTLSSNISPITQADSIQINQYDRRYFPAPRPKFLECWLHPQEGIALVYKSEGEILGYGAIRRCFTGYKIGPLFAEHPDVAEQLFLALVAETQGDIFYLDIPEPNTAALELVSHHQMQACFKTIRMYTREEPKINLDHIFGFTTFEIG